MRRAGQEPRRSAVPGATGAGSRDGAAAQWEVQVARGPVNWAADGGGEAADRRRTAKALAKACGWPGDHGRCVG